MTQTWQTAWETVESNSPLTYREGQQQLGNAIFGNVFGHGQLVAEGPTGVGKSFTALIPAITAAKEKSERTILTTETLSLLDQIVDKDLPFLFKIYGDFTYFGLKGRNHYYCANQAPRHLSFKDTVEGRLSGTNGERRDVEKILGYRMDDDDWAEICGNTEACSGNQCTADEGCYSTRARNLAMSASIVVTSHAMLQVQGEFIQAGQEDGLLGKFEHIIVDEAHSLEQVVVSGSTLQVAPWDIGTRFNNIIKGNDKVGGKYHSRLEDAQRDVEQSIDIIKEMFRSMAGDDITGREWAKQSYALALVYTFAGNPRVDAAMDKYENVLPTLAATLSDKYTKLGAAFSIDLKEMMEKKSRGRKEVSVAITACGYLASLFGLIANSVITNSGTVEAYGTTFALFADGTRYESLGKESLGIHIRAVPLDVSGFLKRNLWDNAFSVTAISATLRDQTDGSFRFLKRSIGLDNEAKEIRVESPFDFARQQLIYLTDGEAQDVADVPGAKFSMQELRELLSATQGRTLVLFTAMSELQYVADQLRYDKSFPYTVLVQEKGADKAELAEKFKSDTNSVLLASRSFFQGFDVPGEALTQVILVKFSNPRYDATMKALIRHWRERGFPRFYEMKAMEVFVQAFGRGVRSADCKVVCSLIDYRVGDEQESVNKSVHHVIRQSYAQSEVTSDVSRIGAWLTA